MRRILFGGVFALVIGTLLAGDASGQYPIYNMHCVRVFTGGGDPAPQTNPQNYAVPDGAMVSWNSSQNASTPGTGLLVTGSPTVIDEVQAISGNSITANDGIWLASTTTEAQANCFAPIGADVYVPQIQNEVSANLAASGPDFINNTLNAWYDEAFTYTAYTTVDPYVTDSFGTLYGTLYLMASGSPADGNVSGGLELLIPVLLLADLR